MRKQFCLAAVAAMLMGLPSCVDSFATRNNPYINDMTPRYGHGGRYSPSQQGYAVGNVKPKPPEPKPQGGYQGPGGSSSNTEVADNTPPPSQPGSSGTAPNNDGGSATPVTPPREEDKPPVVVTPPPPPAPDPKPPVETIKKGPGGIPYGIPVPGKKGYVYSPYAKDQGYVDVRDFSSGTKVTDPYSGKIILVP